MAGAPGVVWVAWVGKVGGDEEEGVGLVVMEGVGWFRFNDIPYSLLISACLDENLNRTEGHQCF